MNRRSILRSGSFLISGLAGCATQYGEPPESNRKTGTTTSCESLPSDYLYMGLRNHTDSEVSLTVRVSNGGDKPIFEVESTLAPLDSDGDVETHPIDIAESGVYQVGASTSQLSASEDWRINNSCDSLGVSILSEEIVIRKYGRE